MPTLEQAKPLIAERVAVFARHRAQYRADEYKEAQLRREFLDPFFEALGWDVTNRQGLAEQYKEVVNEDALKIAGTTKAPDYSFRIGGVRKFFAEAKKPTVPLKTDREAAYQLRRYAWSAQLPLSILSDFEELAIYDCRARPFENDKASVGRIALITFDQYLDRLPEIFDVFSKAAVLRGAFDQSAHAIKTKRGTSPVDAEFLKEIEGWRATLAKNIATLNPRLTIDEINDAVQRTIDRIIFLRMAEDRGAEPYGRLAVIANRPERSEAESKGAMTSGGVYARFLKLCRDADDKYNSGLFDFATDTLTPALKIDDDKLSGILRALYYPQSPYEFSVLADDTLGNVYEQFLGKVIRLTPTHQARIEEKPAVKKAGGVYYTPAYIVDYIVAQTVGKMIAGKSPDDLVGRPAGSPFRVLDPACGSGSFLLGAYEALLAHCLAWSVAHRDDKRARERIYESARGWRLTTAEKKRILTTHIFGVDIDRQAVEVTKLSLLLKVLEDETDETLGKQLALFKERALPNLDANIRCGNSLIGTTRPGRFFDASRFQVSDEEYRRINPFDWSAFRPGRSGKAFQVSDGFDCIIGNPPYVRIQTLKEWTPLEVEMYKEQYAAARAGNYDIYVVFVEKAFQLLNERGRLGFILPHKFFNAQYGEPLREFIARGKHLARVVHFGDQQIFAGATTYTCLMFLDKAGSDACEFVKVDDLNAWRAEGKTIEGTIPATSITNAEWNFAVGKDAALFERLRAMPVKLGDVADIFVGVQTSADPIFILPFRKSNSKTVCVYSKATEQEFEIEKEIAKRLLKGAEIHAYDLDEPENVILFPYQIENGAAKLYSEAEMRMNFPLAWNYLLTVRKKLEAREGGKWRVPQWWQFGRNQNIAEMAKPKLITQVLSKRASFTFDANAEYCFVGGGNAGGYGVRVALSSNLADAYVLGLLNSRPLDWYLKKISTPFRGGFFSYARRFIEQLPIRALNLADAADKAAHDQIVALVTQMLELHTRLRAAQTAHDRDLVQRQIDATDAAIDALVYELYGVTEEERQVVEGK
jgi:hypothetical protein